MSTARSPGAASSAAAGVSSGVSDPLLRALLSGSTGEIRWQLERRPHVSDARLHPLLLHRQLSHWAGAQGVACAAEDAETRRAHHLDLVRWTRGRDAEAEDDEEVEEEREPGRINAHDLLLLCHAVASNLHASSSSSSSLACSFELVLVELRRHLLLDRLARTPATKPAFLACVRRMLPLAYQPKHAPLTRENGVWMVAPSEAAWECEQELEAEMQELAKQQWDKGGDRKAVTKYLAAHPFSDFVSLLDSYLQEALEEWLKAHRSLVAVSSPAEAASSTSPAAGLSRKRARRSSPAARNAEAAHAAAAASAAASSAQAAPAAREQCGQWTFDDLCVTARELEDLLTPAMYSSVSPAPASLSDEELPADEQLTKRRKRAAMRQIHACTHPEIETFLQQRKADGDEAAAAPALAPAKAPKASAASRRRTRGQATAADSDEDEAPTLPLVAPDALRPVEVGVARKRARGPLDAFVTRARA